MIKNHDIMVEQWGQWCQASCGKTWDKVVVKNEQNSVRQIIVKNYVIMVEQWKQWFVATCNKIKHMLENMSTIELV